MTAKSKVSKLKKAKSKHLYRVSLSVLDGKLHCESVISQPLPLPLADGILIKDVLSVQVDSSNPRFIYILTTQLEVCLKSEGDDDAKPLAQALHEHRVTHSIFEVIQTALQKEQEASLQRSDRIRGIPIGFFLTVFALAAATQLSHVHIKGQPAHVLAMDYSCALSERLFGHFLWQSSVEANGTQVSVPPSSTPSKTLLHLSFSANATLPISTTAAIVSIIAPEGSFLREQALIVAFPLLFAVVAGFGMLHGLLSRKPNWQRHLRVAAWLFATAVLFDYAWTTSFLYEIPILASVLLTLATGTLLRAIFVAQLLRDETAMSNFGFLCAKVLLTHCTILIGMHPELNHLYARHMCTSPFNLLI
jgi:hypothetical protein